MIRAVAVLTCALAWVASPTQAQTVLSRASESIRIGGRLHTQYAASSVESADNDFFFRRARLIADVTINDFVSARFQPEFAGGGAKLQDAYMKFAFSDVFEVSMGQFKVAFDLFDLASSTDLSLIERDGRVAGVSSCSGVGGACSLTRLSEKLNFAGRDQGVRIEGARGRLEYMATVTNGTGANNDDENDAKSVSARVSMGATDGVRVGGAVAAHDYVGPGDENGRAAAFTVDVDVGTWRDGLHGQLAFTLGDNWKVLDPAGDEATFSAVQGWVSYYVATSSARVVGVEPLARVSFADPDGDSADDGAFIFTPGLMLYVGGKNKIGVNVDVFSLQAGDTEYSFKVQSFLYF